MSDRPKIYVKPNGSIRASSAADFVDAESNVLETKENFLKGMYRRTTITPLS